jgi:hypothetical protein
MVFLIRGIQTVVQVDANVAVEEVADANTATQNFVAELRKVGAAEHVSGEASTEAATASRSRSGSHRGLGILGGRANRACYNARCERYGHEDRSE